PPVGARPAAGVPAFREQRNVSAASPDRFADEALAVVVALRGVDHVQAGVERAAEQPRHRPRADALIADLGAAEAEHARDDVRSSEPALLHSYRRLGNVMDRHGTIGPWRG